MSNKIKGAKRIYPQFKTAGELRYEGILKQAKAFAKSHFFLKATKLGSKSIKQLMLYK